MTVEYQSSTKPEVPEDEAQSTSNAEHTLVRILKKVGQLLGGAVSPLSSSLTKRILVLNLVGLVALFLGFLYLNQFRAGLIEARTQSLLTQGEIIASAIAASATVETDNITLDLDKLLQLQAGESSGDEVAPLDFSINPEQVAPVLRRLITPTRTRARIFDREGMLLLDSRHFYSRGDILRFDLPPLKHEPGMLERGFNWFMQFISGSNSAFGEEFSANNGRNMPELKQALAGTPSSAVRVNTQGQTIVYVAVPIQKLRIVRGALLLSTQGSDIDAIIAGERWALMRVFIVSAIIMTVLSVLLAGTIADPVRRLAEAAERVRRGIKSRQEIPDFTDRSDEIGHLSGALRDMTQALYRRIDAIESFAADVSHELKNPLTSMRSAVETLPLAKSNEARARLMDVIQHDVKRLDRLISDISDASRLDAELARIEAEPVDIAQLVQAIAGVARGVHSNPVIVNIAETTDPKFDYLVFGHDGRLGQVLNNLVDNALSFSNPDDEITIDVAREGRNVVIAVEDNGPGIPTHALERIFERFYTDRPEQKFGQNSGLGLSISRQIVEAHRGQIEAGNRNPLKDGQPVTGARFVVRLPVIIQNVGY